MNETIVVCDLETSLDRPAFARASHVAEDDLEKITQVLGDVFPKPIFHRIEAIGVLRANLVEGVWHVDRFGAPHRGERSECELIEGFARSLEPFTPKLVTWNGTSFDLPVLRWRAMLHEISAPALSRRKYFARYLDDAVDLCDVLASFDGRSKVSLDHACRAFWIGGKPDNVDGSKVQQMVDEGRFDIISNYCERDVVMTYLLWLRFELFCGRLSPDGYQASLSNVFGHLQNCVARNPLLGDLIPASKLTRSAPHD